MNMWGLQPEVFEYIRKDFAEFLENIQNPMKEEFYIPTVVDNMIKRENKKVRVLPTSEKWYGVTYKEDKEIVVKAMREKIAQGCYEGI